MDVIILNGASSSGKSSIAKQLQALLPSPYLHLGIDTFIAMMPEQTNSLSAPDNKNSGFYWQTTQVDGKSSLRIQSGEYGLLVNRAYHSTVKHLVANDLKVIVDDVMNGGEEQSSWRAALDGCRCVYVGVFCELDELERREIERGDRSVGSAREQVQRVHHGVQYDVTVSTSAASAQECAQQIVTYVNGLTRL